MNWMQQPTAGHDVHGQSAVYSDDGSTVAIVYDGKEHAGLIAAAPDLLHACKMLLPIFTEKYKGFWDAAGVGPGEGMHLHSMLHAAIAKATE